MYFHYHHNGQQTIQPTSQPHPSQFQQQQDYYPQEYVQENSYLGGMPQMQPTMQYEDGGYFGIGTAMQQHQQPSQLADNCSGVPAQMYQPSPIVHAPIPILGAQFQEHGAYEPQNVEAVATDSNFSPDAEYPAESTYGQGGHYAYHPTGVTQPQPHSWDDVISQPFSGPTFPTPSELLLELGATFESVAITDHQSEGSNLGRAGGGGFGRLESMDFGPYGDEDNFNQVPSPSTIQRAVDSASPEGSSCDSVRISTPRSQTAPRSQQNHRGASSRPVSILPDAAPGSSSNPESITSHEKKRHYLDCLEQYVLYLHNQFDLLGKVPVRIKRVDKYEGLNSRSIRTLLVHMDRNNKKLNAQTVAEETKFIALRAEVYRKTGKPEEGDKK